jgi:hypothetical protein
MPKQAFALAGDGEAIELPRLACFLALLFPPALSCAVI